MITKKNIDEIKKMSSSKISEYITDITQTPICADKKYCDEVIKIFMSKPIGKSHPISKQPSLI